MYFFLENVNNLVLNVQKNRKENDFSFLFFDKFKNLLDDYIVNYLIKYLFYFLFISFFLLEISFNFFNFINLPNTGGNIVAAFMIDLFNSFSSLFVLDFLYQYIAFNLNSIVYIISLLSFDGVYFFSLLILVVVYSVYVFFFFLIDKHFSIYSSFVLYLLYSFLFFLLSYLGLISIPQYVLFSLVVFLFVLLFNSFSSIGTLESVILGAFFLFSFLFFKLALLVIFLLLMYWVITTKLDFVAISINNNNDLNVVVSALFYYFFGLLMFKTLSLYMFDVHYAMAITICYTILSISYYINHFFFKNK